MKNIPKHYERRQKLNSSNEMFVVYSRKQKLKDQQNKSHQEQQLRSNTSQELNYKLKLLEEGLSSILDRSHLEKKQSLFLQKSSVQLITQRKIPYDTYQHIQQLKKIKQTRKTQQIQQFKSIILPTKNTIKQTMKNHIFKGSKQYNPMFSLHQLLQESKNVSTKKDKKTFCHNKTQREFIQQSNNQKINKSVHIQKSKSAKKDGKKSIQQLNKHVQKRQVLKIEFYNQNHHRNRITGISVYEQSTLTTFLTCSKDYTLKSLSNKIATYPSNINAILCAPTGIYSCCGDGYLRSTQGYIRRLQSTPFDIQFSQSHLSQVLVAAKTAIYLIDLYKNIILDQLPHQENYQLLKNGYFGTQFGLQAVDFRTKVMLYQIGKNMFQNKNDRKKGFTKWLSNGEQFCHINNNTIVHLGRNYKIKGQYFLSQNFEYQNYCWNNKKLYVLGNRQQDSCLWRIKFNQGVEEVDRTGADACVCWVGDGTVAYGGKRGWFQIKNLIQH